MQKIMFNQRYGLQQAVFDGRKPITRREPYFGEVKNPNVGFLEGKDKNRLALADGNFIVAKSRYAVGEVVAIAQSYHELGMILAERGMKRTDDKFDKYYLARQFGCVCDTDAGWDNKMFVKAELMPHHIKITDIKAERLQDISDDDCLREGIIEGEFMNTWDRYYFDEWGDVPNHITFETPREAFAALIDKVSGKGAWERNPWVFAYSFERID